MNSPIDAFPGTKVELLTVLHRDPKRSTPTAPYYLCRCVCGKVRSFHKALLVSRAVVSCGCSAAADKKKLEAGTRFNLWTLIEKDAERSTKTVAYWRCRCECGSIKSVAANNLRSGMSRSCGCLRQSSKRTITAKLGRPKKVVDVSATNGLKVDISAET